MSRHAKELARHACPCGLDVRPHDLVATISPIGRRSWMGRIEHGPMAATSYSLWRKHLERRTLRFFRQQLKERARRA